MEEFRTKKKQQTLEQGQKVKKNRSVVFYRHFARPNKIFKKKEIEEIKKMNESLQKNYSKKKEQLWW